MKEVVKMMEKVAHYEIVKSTINGDVMPLMKITVLGGENLTEEIEVGYLSPFGGYEFRVSSSKSEDGKCLAASDNVGLATILFANYNVPKRKYAMWGYQTFRTESKDIGLLMLHCMAQNAILEFTNNIPCGAYSTDTLTKYVEICANYIAQKTGSSKRYEVDIYDKNVKYCDEDE